MLRLGLAALLALSALGCSSKEPTYSVVGKVVYKGTSQPAAAGAGILFESTKEPYARAAGKIEADGSFVLSTDRPDNGAIQGEHRVSIVPMAQDGTASDLTAALSRKIDPKYFELRTSGLKFTIQPTTKNEFLIEVEKPK